MINFHLQILRKKLGLKDTLRKMKQVKIAHSFLQSVSNQFHVIILRLPM